MKSNGYRVAVVGATGAVGREMVQVLEERKFPVSDLTLLASNRSMGEVISFQGEDYRVETLTMDSFKDIDIALFSAGGSVSKIYVPAAASAGAVAIDNTSAFRMEADVALVVPEVNPEAIRSHKGIIANPNCSTIQMVVAAKPIHDAAHIKRIIVTTFQAAGGAGKKGMDELFNQTVSILNHRDFEVKVHAIPDSREEVSGLVFMVPKAELRRFANSNHSAANVLVRTGELGSRAVRTLVARIEAVVERLALEPALRVEVTGNAVVLNRSADALAGNQISSIALASATVLLLVYFVFRSLRISLLVMAPNLTPVILFFGMLGLGIAPLSLPTSMIGCVVLGVAVDDTVHMLVTYRRLRERGDSPEAAVLHSRRSYNRADRRRSACSGSTPHRRSSAHVSTRRQPRQKVIAAQMVCSSGPREWRGARTRRPRGAATQRGLGPWVNGGYEAAVARPEAGTDTSSKEDSWRALPLRAVTVPGGHPLQTFSIPCAVNCEEASATRAIRATTRRAPSGMR